ncbi:hypothetical protein [Colwellia psychrerythraea]|nr:hypothetical protein [Colwellia psychrerythraea]
MNKPSKVVFFTDMDKVKNSEVKSFATKKSYHVSINSISTSVYETERNSWNESLLKICSYCEDKKELANQSNHFNDLLDFMANLAIEKSVHNRVLEDARNAFLTYYEDNKTNQLNKFPEPSVDSLMQLVRFIPEISRLKHNVYIDENTGAFGLTLKSSKKSKPILNLLMKENKEVTFSFIKKGKGIIKITGRAFFNHNLEDSHEIYNLIRMVKS